MDKQLLKAYIRTIVEEEVKRVLPELLGEAVQQVKQLSESKQVSSQPAKKFSRGELAQMMGIDYDGETLRATGVSSHASSDIPPGTPPEIKQALTRDYSQLMKKMGLS
jgi:hypothetical protein